MSSDTSLESHCEHDETADEVEITPEMIDAGADAILCVVGGADLGGFFSAQELAARVYRAMALHHHLKTPMQKR